MLLFTSCNCEFWISSSAYGCEFNCVRWWFVMWCDGVMVWEVRWLGVVGITIARPDLGWS